MNSCRLPDSQEKENLIHYLKMKIKECEDGVYSSETSQGISREEEKWWTKLELYREILEMIR